MTRNRQFLIYLLCFAAIGVGLILGYRSHERSLRTQHIQTGLEALKVRQGKLKDQFNSLAAESAKAPNDPAVLKELGARHLKLVREDEALAADLDRLQKEIDANK